MSFNPFAGTEIGSRADGSASALREPPASPSAALDIALPAPDMLDVIERADNAPGAAGSLQTLANYLTSGYWNDTGRTTRYFNLTGAGTGANFGVLYYNVAGYSGDSDGISAARANLVREAFKVYGEVLGITFIETTSTADHVDFFFQDNGSGRLQLDGGPFRDRRRRSTTTSSTSSPAGTAARRRRTTTPSRPSCTRSATASASATRATTTPAPARRPTPTRRSGPTTAGSSR